MEWNNAFIKGQKTRSANPIGIESLSLGLPDSERATLGGGI
jgi:hypothetical protein